MNCLLFWLVMTNYWWIKALGVNECCGAPSCSVFMTATLPRRPLCFTTRTEPANFHAWLKMISSFILPYWATKSHVIFLFVCHQKGNKQWSDITSSIVLNYQNNKNLKNLFVWRKEQWAYLSLSHHSSDGALRETIKYLNLVRLRLHITPSPLLAIHPCSAVTLLSSA